MSKGVCHQGQRGVWRIADDARAAAAAGLLLAISLPAAWAQGVPAGMPQAQAAPQGLPGGVPALSLPRAVALAQEGHPELAAARRELEALEGPLLQGRARPNPELAYSLEDTRTATRTQTWQLNWPVELGGKRAARIEAAERALGQARADLDAQTATVRANVVAAYFETLAAQERAALARDSLALARAATEAVAKRVLAGKVSPVEETKARVAEAGVRVELAQATSEQRSAWLRLSALLGRAGAAPMPPLEGQAYALPALTGPDQLRERILASPALQRARIEVDRRQALTALERARQVPDITLSAGVKRSNELQRNQVLLGVSVPLPVFDRNQGNLLEALKREDKARDELQAANVRLQSEAMLAHERLGAIREEATTLQRDVLPGAKSAYDAATVGFEHGKFSFLEVLDAQRTYFAAKSQYLKALAEAHRAAADIDRLLGVPATAPAWPANPN